MQRQTFDIQNCTIRKTVTFSRLSSKLELSFTTLYDERSVLKLVLAGETSKTQSSM